MAALTYVLLLAVIALGVPLAINLQARVNAEVRTQAQAQADLVAATAADLLRSHQLAELPVVIRTAANSLRGRILVVDSSGRAIADSATPPQIGTSYLTRPEVRVALAGRQVQVQRHSATLGQEILATAVPMISGGRPFGAVRVTQSIAAVQSAVRRAELGLALIGLIVLALGLAAGAIIARQVTVPIRRLEAVARRVAQGDLNARAVVEGSSEQRSLSTSFNEMTERTARLLETQRAFVADASHQLRTPLTGLRLRLEEANAISADLEVREEIRAAIAEVDRLAHTVREMLILSRVGERPVDGASINLGDVTRSSLKRWSSHAAAREIRLELERDQSARPVWASLPDLERALDALIENALNYSPRGTTVTIASGPGWLEVRDRGPGIAPDERDGVLERFHRGRAGVSGPAGSGLGLAIAVELARGWRGDVALDDRPGGGTVARLTVPEDAAPEGTLPVLNRHVDTVR